MDRYDPTTWTESFVASESQFCIQELIKGSKLCAQYAREKDYFSVEICVNVFLQGLSVLQNSRHVDCRFYFCEYSRVLGLLSLELENTPKAERSEATLIRLKNDPNMTREEKEATIKAVSNLRSADMRDFALSAMEDARDFAPSDDIKASLAKLVSDIRSGVPAVTILNKELGKNDVASALSDKLQYLAMEFEKYMNGQPEKMKAASSTASTSSSGSSGGCYVATCVYGSYDCPQVWTLRRYRDFTLANSWFGRVFICTYYAISPTLVKWFGKAEWFKKMCKTPLDRLVSSLNAKGFDNTFYRDSK